MKKQAAVRRSANSTDTGTPESEHNQENRLITETQCVAQESLYTGGGDQNNRELQCDTPHESRLLQFAVAMFVVCVVFWESKPGTLTSGGDLRFHFFLFFGIFLHSFKYDT